MLCSVCQGAGNIYHSSGAGTVLVPLKIPPEMFPCPKCKGWGTTVQFGPQYIGPKTKDK